MKKKKTPNYKVIRLSIVQSKITAYQDLVRANEDYMDHTFINMEGEFCIVGDPDKYMSVINNAQKRYNDVTQLLVDYDKDPDYIIDNKLFPEAE